MENDLSALAGDKAGTETPKSQKRPERQRRRKERRMKKQGAEQAASEEIPPKKKRKSLPGFMAKYRREIRLWLRHYMILIQKADDAGVPYIREMTREQRNDLVQEYVDVSEFRKELETYLDEEDAGKENRP